MNNIPAALIAIQFQKESFERNRPYLNRCRRRLEDAEILDHEIALCQAELDAYVSDEESIFDAKKVNQEHKRGERGGESVCEVGQGGAGDMFSV